MLLPMSNATQEFLQSEQSVHFWGHVVPGTMWLGIGVYNLIRVCMCYHYTRSRGRPFTTKHTYPISTKFGYVQVEGYIKLIAVVEIVGEILTAVRPLKGPMADVTNTQHGTMSAGFVISGLTDLVLHHKIVYIPHADYVAFINALFVEGILFYFHLLGRDEENTRFHILLVYVIGLTILVLIGEMMTDTVIVGMIRAGLYILQGTWFYQVAGSLYTGSLLHHEQTHSRLMWIVVFFSWHVHVVFVNVVLVFFVVGRFYKYNNRPDLGQGRYELLAAHQGQGQGQPTEDTAQVLQQTRLMNDAED